MKELKKKQNGITLIALVISIIVMLILAGVSLNLTIGDNGIVTQAKVSILENKFANYKEEMQMNLVQDINVEKINDKIDVTLMNENVEKYIPSLEGQYVGKFAIVEGKLYYIGDDNLEIRAAKSQGIGTLEDGVTVDEYLAQVEGMAIEALLKNMTGDSFTTTDSEGNVSKVGIDLYDKVLSNGDKWKIITEVNNNETVATYGTGWTYVEKGSTVEGIGELSQSYIIDYANRKKVRFDANKHSMLAFGSNLAVKDSSLVLNIDPINMADSNLESWGDVECVNFSPSGDYDEAGNLISGWNGNAIRFDGVDDYIKFYGGGDFSKGYTFSFYAMTNSGNIKPLTKQNTSIPYSLRTTLYNNCFQFNLSKRVTHSLWAMESFKSTSNPYSTNNGILRCYFDEAYDLTKGAYLDMVFNPTLLQYSIYVNGVFIDSTTVPESYWISSVDDDENYRYAGIDILEDETLSYRIGTYFGGEGCWYYSAFDLYCARMYNRPLSEAELRANYTATVSYHNILVNGGEAETGGDTGGENY